MVFWGWRGRGKRELEMQLKGLNIYNYPNWRGKGKTRQLAVMGAVVALGEMIKDKEPK